MRGTLVAVTVRAPGLDNWKLVKVGSHFPYAMEIFGPELELELELTPWTFPLLYFGFGPC